MEEIVSKAPRNPTAENPITAPVQSNEGKEEPLQPGRYERKEPNEDATVERKAFIFVCWRYKGIYEPHVKSKPKELRDRDKYEDRIKELEEFLTACDYQVHVICHPDHETVDEILDDLRASNGEKEEEVIFYYVGHGIEYGYDKGCEKAHTGMILPFKRQTEEEQDETDFLLLKNGFDKGKYKEANDQQKKLRDDVTVQKHMYRIEEKL